MAKKTQRAAQRCENVTQMSKNFNGIIYVSGGGSSGRGGGIGKAVGMLHFIFYFTFICVFHFIFIIFFIEAERFFIYIYFYLPRRASVNQERGARGGVARQ